MRVIVIADFAVPSGGSQRVAIESARALAEQGINVTYLHAVEGHDPALDHPSIERICIDVPDIWDRDPFGAAVHGVWNREAARRVVEALSPYSGGPGTVVHLHQWTRAFSPSIFPALRSLRVPVAVTAHDYFLACPNGVLFRFDRKEPCALKPMSGACLSANCDPRSYPHKLVRVARQAATNRQWRGWDLDVVHISDRSRARLAALLPPTWRHHRIDNPIGVTRAPPAVIAPGAPFVFVGRLTEDKGAIIVARAAAEIGANMLFIGEGPARSQIQAILPNADITGWVDTARVEALLRDGARAVVAPSLWPETGPLTVREAAAIGLASVVSARCGASEFIDPSSGFVAEPNVADLSVAMLKLAHDGVARAMGAAAYARFWAKPPSPANHANALIDFYDRLLSA